MTAAQVQARQKFDALFARRNPTKDEMLIRPDFLLLAASVGMSLGECWDALVKKASDPQFGGNLELAAQAWYAQVAAPRF